MSAIDPITAYDDIIDSRDVIERIEYLATLPDDANDVEQGISEEEREELSTLVELARQGEDCAGDWADGTALVRDSYFQQYAEELADEVVDGFQSTTSNWPFTCIDWGKAARELQQDYTSVKFDGVTYWTL